MAILAGRASSERDIAQLSVNRLEGLAAVLARRGFVTRLQTPAGRVPRLHVANPAAAMLAEDVYAGRSQDGLWWFWWPWAERIGPVDDPAAAAEAVARVLGSSVVPEPS